MVYNVLSQIAHNYINYVIPINLVMNFTNFDWMNLWIRIITDLFHILNIFMRPSYDANQIERAVQFALHCKANIILICCTEQGK